MPKGYIYAELDITDPVLFRTYAEMAPGTVAAYGGRYLIGGGDPKQLLEGDGPMPRSAVLEFDSPEMALEWYNSPEYRPAREIRQRACRTKVHLLTGRPEA